MRKMGLAFASMNWGFGCAKASHQPACFFSPFSTAGHTSTFQIRHLNIKPQTQLPCPWRKSMHKRWPPCKPAGMQPFARRHMGCREHRTSSDLPIPVKTLVAGTIWTSAAVASWTLVTSRTLGTEEHQKDPRTRSLLVGSSPRCHHRAQALEHRWGGGAFIWSNKGCVISKGLVSVQLPLLSHVSKKMSSLQSYAQAWRQAETLGALWPLFSMDAIISSSPHLLFAIKSWHLA